MYTGPTSSSADSIMPGTWQGCHHSTSFQVTVMTQPGESPTGTSGFDPRSADLVADALPLGHQSGLNGD